MESRGTPCRASLVLLCVSAAIAVLACERRPNSDAALSHTFPTAEAAARAVLDALAREDAVALRRLALTEHEFRTVVWPELPASRPEVNLPLEYVWGTLHQNSSAGVAQILTERGGRRYELVSLRRAGESTRYASFSVHRKVELVVRNAAGEASRVRLFGSLLERHGRWKIFSYVVD